VPSRIAPELNNEVTEAVDDDGVLAKARLAVDVADGPNPLRNAIGRAAATVLPVPPRVAKDVRMA
jgi:hypothetical protein